MKRYLKIILVFVICIMCCAGSALALEDSPKASTTITKHQVSLLPGLSSGEIDVDFRVVATGTATSLGISTISFYHADGTFIETVIGTTTNQLVGSGRSYAHTYTYTNVTSGEYYYAYVTVFARVGNQYDSISYYTNTVQAP